VAVGVGVHVGVTVGSASVGVTAGVGVQSDPRQGGAPTVGVAATGFERGAGDNLLAVVFICWGGGAAVAAEVSRLQTTNR